MIGSGLTEHVLECSVRRDGVEMVDGSGAQTSVLTLKKNDYGLWQQVWPHGTPAARFLQDAQRARHDLGRYGLVYRQPGTEVVVASGPVTTVIDSFGRRNGIASDALSCWGVTDLTHLRERIVFPDPTVDIPLTSGTLHQWPSFTRTKTGPAETVALEFIRENIGSTALARRRLAYFTLVIPVTQNRGPVVTRSPQANSNVLEVVQELMALAGLVIDVKQTARQVLTVEVRTPAVRTNIVWMPGDGGTASGISIKASRRPKTDVIASGSGDDPSAPYARRVAAAPPGGYSEVREEFIKGSGSIATTDRPAQGDQPARTVAEQNADLVAKLVADADEELIEDGPEYGLDVEPSEGTVWRVGIDYNLGDLTKAHLPGDDEQPGASFDVPVNTVLLRHDDGTLTEEPTAAFDDDFSIEPLLRRIFRKITRAER